MTMVNAGLKGLINKFVCESKFTFAAASGLTHSLIVLFVKYF